MVNASRRTALFIVLVSMTHVALVAQSVSLSVAYEDKAIYVPGSDVLISFTIRNESGGTFRFKLAENRMFSVDLDVRTLANQALPPARQFAAQRTSSQQLFYRDVSLEPGEAFSFVENLRDYVDLSDTGVFVVHARFYPALIAGNSVLRAQNSLSLTIQPDLRSDELIRARINADTGEILGRAALPPDETVDYVLQALQRGSWNRFFLYIDMEGLLLSDPVRSRAYRRMSHPEQRERLAHYAVELERRLEDPDLSAAPTDYRLVRTTYDSNEATVIKDLRFVHPRFTEVKRYTYFLRRTDRVWYIYDYAVMNLGTE
jgi:hypothetical protein